MISDFVWRVACLLVGWLAGCPVGWFTSSQFQLLFVPVIISQHPPTSKQQTRKNQHRQYAPEQQQQHSPGST
jgi:hypothetical protein